MDSVKVRKAKREDMQHVMKLIEELATFENMPKHVKINATILERDGFDVPSPVFMCYVAESSHLEIVGYALFYYTYSTWLGKSVFLEDLYVQPTYRRRGIGKELFLTAAKEAYLNKTRLDFQVLAWNPAKEFYNNLGAVNLTETEHWQSFRLNMNALTNIFGTK
ncbi:uncharacterized protein CBL_01076 [Carabus blaptoides fortunei]